MFLVNQLPDSGDFSNGQGAGVKWDILSLAGRHDIPEKISLANTLHLKPYSIACLCAIGRLAKIQDKHIDITMPDNSGCADHLNRLGLPLFFDSKDSEYHATRNTNLPTRVVSWPPGNEAAEIVNLLSPIQNLAPGLFPQFESHIDEIITNALTHANSPIDCVIAGQQYQGTKKIEICILDLGQTIRGHLSKNPKFANCCTTDHEAIIKATEDMVTGTCDSQPNARGQLNSGAGLAELRSYCESGGGELTVLSGNHWVTFSANSEPVVAQIYGGFAGCLVNVRFFTDFSLNFDAEDAIL